MKDDILVAIRCTVYNHEPYLRDCLNGFVMQKTNFRFVAIVHDDCSKDKSAAIIREYAEEYPDIIKPIYETENQFSKRDGSLQRVMWNSINETGAKYVAMCEGDDFWIDPYKLQKQVDYMENHPECTCYAHNSLLLKTATQQIDLFNKELLYTKDYELREFLNKTWFTPTQSLLYRNEAYTSFEDLPRFMHGDYAILLNVLLKEGRYLHYDNQIMSVYRDGGWASSHYRELDLFDDFVALLTYYKEKSDHQCDEVFDGQIAVQKKEKEHYIQRMQDEKNNKKLVNRIKRKLTRIFKAIC